MCAGWRNPPTAPHARSQLGRSAGGSFPEGAVTPSSFDPAQGAAVPAEGSARWGCRCWLPARNPQVASQACGVQRRGQGGPLQKARAGSGPTTGSGEACGRRCRDEGRQVWAGGQARTQAGGWPAGQGGQAGRGGAQEATGAPRVSQCPAPDPSLEGQGSRRPGLGTLPGPEGRRPEEGQVRPQAQGLRGNGARTEALTSSKGACPQQQGAPRRRPGPGVGQHQLPAQGPGPAPGCWGARCRSRALTGLDPHPEERWGQAQPGPGQPHRPARLRR